MKNSVIFLLLISCGVANAAGWSAPLTIEREFTQNSDVIVVYTAGSPGYVSGCNANAWVFKADTETRRSRAWAAILTALTTGQKLQLWYNDICGTFSYHETTSIMLIKPN